MDRFLHIPVMPAHSGVRAIALGLIVSKQANLHSPPHFSVRVHPGRRKPMVDLLETKMAAIPGFDNWLFLSVGEWMLHLQNSYTQFLQAFNAPPFKLLIKLLIQAQTDLLPLKPRLYYSSSTIKVHVFFTNILPQTLLSCHHSSPHSVFAGFTVSLPSALMLFKYPLWPSESLSRSLIHWSLRSVWVPYNWSQFYQALGWWWESNGIMNSGGCQPFKIVVPGVCDASQGYYSNVLPSRGSETN